MGVSLSLRRAWIEITTYFETSSMEDLVALLAVSYTHLIESNVETFLNNLQPRHKIDTLRAEISEQCKTAGECAKPVSYTHLQWSSYSIIQY